VQRVGGANTPVPYASNLEADFIPQVHDIEAAVRRTLG
jgi:pyruvate/2-oxoglutarate/acetoin dehydrogenase E1 component